MRYYCICYCYYFTSWEFFTSALASSFSLESEWQKVPSNLESSVVWMDSTLPLISDSSSPFSKPLRTVSTTTGITVTIMFPNFLFIYFFVFWQGLSICLSVRFFDFYSVVRRNGKNYKTTNSVVCVCVCVCVCVLINTRSDLLAGIILENFMHLIL